MYAVYSVVLLAVNGCHSIVQLIVTVRWPQYDRSFVWYVCLVVCIVCVSVCACVCVCVCMCVFACFSHVTGCRTQIKLVLG